MVFELVSLQKESLSGSPRTSLSVPQVAIAAPGWTGSSPSQGEIPGQGGTSASPENFSERQMDSLGPAGNARTSLPVPQAAPAAPGWTGSSPSQGEIPREGGNSAKICNFSQRQIEFSEAHAAGEDSDNEEDNPRLCDTVSVDTMMDSDLGAATLLIKEMRSQQAKAPKWQEYTPAAFPKFRAEYIQYQSQYGRLTMAQLMTPSLQRILCSEWNLDAISLSGLSNKVVEAKTTTLWPSYSMEETQSRLCMIKMTGDTLYHLHDYVHKFMFETKLCSTNSVGIKEEVRIFLKNLRPSLLQQRVLLQGPRRLSEAQSLALSLWAKVQNDLHVIQHNKNLPGGSQTPSKTSKDGSTGSGTPSGTINKTPYVVQCRKCRRLGHKEESCRTRPENYLSEEDGKAALRKALDKAKAEGQKPSGGSPTPPTGAKPAPPGTSGKSSTSVRSKAAKVSFATAEDEPAELEDPSYVTNLSIRVVEVPPGDEDLKMTVFTLSQDVDSARRLRGKLFLGGNKDLANIASIDALLDSGASTNLLAPEYFEKLSEDQRQRFSKKRARVQVADNCPARLEEIPYGPIYLCFSTPLGAVEAEIERLREGHRRTTNTRFADPKQPHSSCI